MRELGHFIAGKPTAGMSGRFGEVFEPTTGEVQARVAFASPAEVAAAIDAAALAYPGWAATNPQKRARVLFRFKDLLEQDAPALARLISSEHGKVLADARGDIQRGLEVIEFACGIPHLQKGERTDGAGPGIDVYSMRPPLGVVAGITPFNFPAMIPMWMFGTALACGNAFILKPSEKDPSAPLRLAELLAEAGLPEGVFTVLNGDAETVGALIEDPRVKAISFVGSSDAAHSVYERSARFGKRVQAFGGAKNHVVVMPDADLQSAANQLIGSAYGSAGERCMATPVAVPVGEATAQALIDLLRPRVEALRIGPSLSEDAEMGPLVTRVHRDRVRDYVDMAVDEGQTLLVDGRGFRLQGYENGFFLGGSLLDGARPGMKSYTDEIFGPVLQIARAADLDEAIGLASRHQYGNGASIFTSSGVVARDFVRRVEAGMVGVNAPIPAPVAYFSFGGWKRSSFGDANQHGTDGVRFWTKVKTVTERWPDGLDKADFVIPTMR